MERGYPCAVHSIQPWWTAKYNKCVQYTVQYCTVRFYMYFSLGRVILMESYAAIAYQLDTQFYKGAMYMYKLIKP